ncbi:MAG TPA: response regulator [Labilithrix sp.]|nr:response regulator [Labilithrix sp.]
MKHVLIVEDDADIREILAEMLTASGYRVTSVSNGLEALQALARDTPSVVVLDLMMPVMDGWELRQRMLADPALRDIPVIIMSGSANLAQSTMHLRPARVLRKPVPLNDVLDAVVPFGA